ncbi:MAG: hypothetical protein P8168_06090 [Deltaproteobacteria bacterium]|jgi:hypothetical protein
MEPKPECDRKVIIEEEEYKALMAELPPPETEVKPTSRLPEIEEKIRKIEFYLLIIVGLVLVFFLFSKVR